HRRRARPENAKLELPPRPPSLPPTFLACLSSVPCPQTMALAAQRKAARRQARSEEHTSELQSLTNLVCRLLLEKKKKNTKAQNTNQGDSTSTTKHKKS